MSSVVISGDTSGAITVAAPAVAGSNTMTLPAATDTFAVQSQAVRQVVSTQTGAVATGTTAMPIDDTIPQNTEGTEFMSVTITPKSATSKLVIRGVANLTNSSAGWIMGVGLFQDSTANALAAWFSAMVTTGGQPVCIPFEYVMTSGTTSATTFKIRAGVSAASGGTVTFNGSGGSRYFGGVLNSCIVITEIGG